MASREVTRLRRLKVEQLSQNRLRQELERATENFAAESETLEKSNATLQTNLRRVSTQADGLNRRLAQQQEALKVAQDERVKAVAEVEQLRELLAQVDRGGLADTKTSDAVLKVTQLELEKVQLESRLTATKALLDAAQKATAARDDGRALIPTRDLYTQMAAEVGDAAAKLPSGFAIDDVEIEVKGALGREGDDVVIGLDPKQQLTGDSATRLKFTLRRAVTETKLE